MRLSIRLRTILALNAFVIGLAVILGWIAQNVAGQMVEERFVKEMVTSASGFLKSKNFPRSNAMMTYLRELFNAEWISSEGAAANIVGSSLPDALTLEFKQQVGTLGKSGVVRLGNQQFRVDSADMNVTGSNANYPVHCRLFMLVPNAQFQEARERAQTQVAKVVMPAVGVATLLAMLLTFSITRPLRKLAKEMDRLADNEGVDTMDQSRPALRGPAEISRLASSFYRLLDRLAAARQRMAQSEQLATLGKICLSVAHELRNPLSGIKMNVRVLKDRECLKDDPGVEAVLREIDRMGLYLNELMSLSPSGDHPERTVSLAPVKLSDLSESVLTILSGRCRHAKVLVERDYPADEPPILADANQIRQAMMNLMVNAVEAMPAGGTMTVALRCLPSSIRFSVADTGKGVQLGGKDIFDAFASGKPNGVGLGLYICRQIVNRHAGQIGYKNKDAGAVFWLELPRQTNALPDKPTEAPSPGGIPS